MIIILSVFVTLHQYTLNFILPVCSWPLQLNDSTISKFVYLLAPCLALHLWMCWAAEDPLKHQWALPPAEKTDSFSPCAYLLTYPAPDFLS